MGSGSKYSVRVMWGADENRVAILHRAIRGNLTDQVKGHLGKSILGHREHQDQRFCGEVYPCVL